MDQVAYKRVLWLRPGPQWPLNMLSHLDTQILAYLDQFGVSSGWLVRLKGSPSRLLVTKEGRHWLFWSILILLDTLLNCRLGLDLGLDFLGRGR